jgi:pyruvate ferredoxin oxidoreductase alpha subunit
MAKKTELMNPYEAAAYGAKISKADVAAAFRKNNKIIKKLAKIHQCQIIETGTPESALIAAAGATACGKRSFATISSLPEEMEKISFMRLPVVAARINSNIKPEAPNALDSGWMVFAPESAQETVDMIPYAYRLAEDAMLPALILIDGMQFTETGVINENAAAKFLPKFRPAKKTDAKNPVSLGPHMTAEYTGFRIQQQKAMTNALELMKKAEKKFSDIMKRKMDAVERYHTEDADTIIVMSGFQAPTAKEAVRKIREKGEKTGLLRLRVLRPWPDDAVKSALHNAKRVIVIDNSFSTGSYGFLYREIKTSYSRPAVNIMAMNRHLSEKDFSEMIENTKKTDKNERIWMV